ncbi:MAG: DEAD/DEAH box helicase [Tannerella sp.]|jgi:SNF2 family DNA or RNA helicase|nr:DEAD/DEAH box helicase [Tannerella sp.]
MFDDLIREYQSLDNEAKSIVHCLSLTSIPVSVSEITVLVKPYATVGKERIQSVINRGLTTRLIKKDPYSKGYIIDSYMLVWIYPLIKQNFQQEKRHSFYQSYVYYGHGYILAYLEALCRHHSRTEAVEKGLLLYAKQQVVTLSMMFFQPAYDAVIPKMSHTVISHMYADFMRQVTSGLDSFSRLQPIDDKLRGSQSPDLICLWAESAFRQGDFVKAQELSSKYDSPITYFSEATLCFFDNRTDEALALFEKGLKKQRRDDKNTHIPLLPEAALFYLTAWLTKEQNEYMSVFNKIIGEKPHSGTLYERFKDLCKYCIQDTAHSELIVSNFQILAGKNPELDLWKVIALGFTGKQPLNEQYVNDAVVLAQRAFENGYLTMAYEAAYVLKRWRDSSEIRRIYDAVSEKRLCQPALSRIRLMEEWEKQLNAYLSLEAVQSAIRKEVHNGKTRVAYRFFPDRNCATPVLQNLNAGGVWSSGRNIAIGTFKEKKADCMTEQDKRIATVENYYSYSLGKQAISQMAGHPYVFLENSDIFVELIAAQPVLSVVKAPDGGYRLESDVTDTHNDILIVKETNTRYKVYTVNQFQREIIRAVLNAESVPEHGREKLLLVLKHFSAHINIQSDLPVNENDSRARPVDTDSHIRVQLLPLGEGLKAELFVKPFGSHPPYCKPGRGGKALIANENGERLQVLRNMEDENRYYGILLNEIQAIESLSTTNDLMSFEHPLDSLELLDILERHQDIAIVEWPEGERYKIRKSVGFSDLNLRIKSGVNWFELEGELAVDENTVLSIKELLELVKHGHGRFVELSNGEFLSLSEQLKRRLAELASCSSASGKGVVINRFASASMVDTFDEFERLKVDKAWHDFRKRLQSVQHAEVAAVPSLLQAELRPYQTAGYQWMLRLAEWGAGACLADDMGLGKTVQAIAVLLHRAQAGPALVVSPVSVMPNWIGEVSRFAPSLNVKTLNDGNRAEILDSLEAGDLLVTSYGLLLSEEEAVTAKQWATVILDEAHAIKNYTTKTSKAAMSLQADFRIVLTGTPLQNHLGEMWNLFQFTNPGLLGSLTHFTDTFVKPGDEQARKRLKKLITPFILRRTKAAVLEELPPKTEIIKKITLGNDEMAFYETLRRKALESLAIDNGPQGAKHLKVLAEITRLRQACCNPLMVAPDIGIESTKLTTFLEIASELKDNGHRALVFSQFVTHLSIVRKALEKNGFTYQYLDGSTSPAKREAAVRNFQTGQGDLFLISLKAGGLGLNLTAADYVIHLDPWWNPAIEDQASDRAHRIGQNRPVTVYRLVAEHTIEEKIIQLHNTKRDLADSLLEGSDQSARLSINELVALINER